TGAWAQVGRTRDRARANGRLRRRLQRPESDRTGILARNQPDRAARGNLAYLGDLFGKRVPPAAAAGLRFSAETAGTGRGQKLSTPDPGKWRKLQHDARSLFLAGQRCEVME